MEHENPKSWWFLRNAQRNERQRWLTAKAPGKMR